ncbi:MAG: hypothetical protein WBE72_00245 [Terracidiphilus sp.]
MFIVLLPITIVAIVGLAYAWVLTYQEVRAAKVLEWPQTIALLSVLAVTMQVVLHFGMTFFFFGTTDRRTIGWIAGFEVLFFLIALPCALKRKGPVRWLLALSSIYFLAFAGFGYMVSGIQF